MDKITEVDAGTIVGLLVIVLETGVGVVSNIFIFIVIGLEFIKQHQVMTSNKLLMPLCFSALCFSTMLTTNNITGMVLPEKSQSGHVRYIFYILNMYSCSSCSWPTSCLCTFYFVKIANFESGCLAWTKMKIDRMVVWMIVMVEAVSLCGALINSQILSLTVKATMSSSAINNTEESMINASQFLNIIYIVNVVPFIVMMITTVLTIVSLNLHVRKMGKNIPSNANLEVHQRVVWTMIQLLIMYSVCYLVMFLLFFTRHGWGNWLYLISMSLFSPIQSGILIHSNPKFIETLKTLCKSGSCFKS
ncbi:taste receptor type 2 member 4-like [Aquarana catesbeiana]|uniref:taste receptor type 2 member 4-like n=1 Tax=Aquarana catesbeiana TaxID=8400 RepID=UPI003CCA27E3